MKLFNRLFGLLQPDATSVRDAPAAPTPPSLIQGAHAAKELVMLPIDGIDAKGNPHVTLTQRRLVQFKADGIRALYVDGRIVSREGAPLDCALHCQPGLARIEKAFGASLVFDGEYVAQDGFAATLAEHKRGTGEGVFWAFDVLPLADWRAGRCDVAVEDRIDFLRDLVRDCDSLFVGMLDAWTLTPTEADAKAREIWAAGGEGIVSKRLGSPYVRARSDDWVRVKQNHTVDGIIVDMAGRQDGTLRSIVVRPIGSDGAGSLQPVVVGTGWSAAEGMRLLSVFNAQHALSEAEPMWAEISFQLTTGAKRSVRGARFHRLRTSKGATA